MSINQTKQNWRTELPETIFRKFLCDCYDLLWVLIILLWFGRPSEPDTQMKMTTVDLSIGFCQFSKLKDNIRIMFLDFFISGSPFAFYFSPKWFFWNSGLIRLSSMCHKTGLREFRGKWSFRPLKIINDRYFVRVRREFLKCMFLSS